MTISTHVRVSRGYFRSYYDRTVDIRREKAREARICRYRRGWALWLIAELREFWSAEARQKSQPTQDCPTISNQWMSYVSDGRSKPSIGRAVLRIRSIG